METGNFIAKPIEETNHHETYIEQMKQSYQEIERNVEQISTRAIVIVYAKSKLETQLPLYWTIDKVKCMLATHYTILDFDKFEFQSGGYLIPGTTTIGGLSESQLVVTQADCKGSFQRFYKKMTKKLLDSYKMSPIEGSSDKSLWPTYHRSLSNILTINMPKQRSENLEPIKRNQNRRNRQNGGLGFFNIMRFVGFFLLFNFITSAANYTQMFILGLVVMIYLVIEHHVNANNRRRRRRERREERREREGGLMEQRGEREREERENRIERNRGQQIQERRDQLEENLDLDKVVLRQQQRANTTKFEGINESQKNQEQISLEKDVVSPQSPFPGKNTNGDRILEHREKGKDESTNSQTQFVKQNEFKSMRERNNANQKTNTITQVKVKKQPFKAKLVLWTAFLAEAFYCFALSIFPNWTVETHLQANEATMDKVLDYVKKLDSEASEMIKNWKKKKDEKSQKIRKSSIHGEDYIKDDGNVGDVKKGQLTFDKIKDDSGMQTMVKETMLDNVSLERIEQEADKIEEIFETRRSENVQKVSGSDELKQD